MNNKELRVGNLILHPWTNEVYEVYAHSFTPDPNKDPDLEDYSPIPITPEWLERLGFQYHISAKGEVNYFKLAEARTSLVVRDINGVFGFVYYKKLQEYSAGHSGFTEEGVHIKYIHQLQNLYFRPDW